MGIQGLLPYLKKVSRSVNIREFKGCTVAIDTYCWLHRGAFACAEKLAVGEKTDQYVYYCIKYVNHLLSLGIKPIMVFDGCHLPSKKEVETSRRERRETYRKKAAQLLREGRRSEARDCLTKCIDITPQMALEVMNACRAKGVDCIVAPYEADSQLAYLNKIGVAQIIISEDSDLILFGCEKVMFKMDPAGNGILVEKRHLAMAMDLRPDSYTFDKFRYMCILSGCDYLPSLSGIGLAKANKVFKLTRQTDMTTVVKKLASTLNMSNLVVPTDYVTGFHKADNTFLYQLVFDPIKRQLVPLNPYPPEVNPDKMHYAGPPIEQKKALQIALGNIDIYTGKQIDNFDPDTHKPKSQSWQNLPHGRDTKMLLHMLSIWDQNYRPMSRISQHDNTETQTRTTHGQEVTVCLPKITKKPAAIKRPREEDEVSPEELLSAYHNTDPDYNPEKRNKILKPDDILPLHLDNEVISAQVVNTEQEICERQYLTPCKTEHLEVTEESESMMKSPLNSPSNTKNRFAVSDLRVKQDKFNLNAGKQKKQTVKMEVKSRFFQEKKPLVQTNFFGELNKSHEQVEQKSDMESDSDIEISNDIQDRKECVSKLQSTGPGLAEFSESQSHDSQIENRSPYGSFGFTKKIGSSYLNKFQNDAGKSNHCLKSKFKPVIPRTGSVDSISAIKVESSKQEASNGEPFSESPEDSIKVDYESDMNSSSVSENSNLYSIDSYSQIDLNIMESTQNINTQDEGSRRDSVGSSYFSESNSSRPQKMYSFPGTATSSSKLKKLSSFYRKSSEPICSSSVIPECMNLASDVKATTSVTPSSSQGSTKLLGGARASGLSKSSNKKGRAVKDKGCIENQPAIMNFFNKFAHGKSSTEKLSSVLSMSTQASPPKSTKVLSPHKDNINTSDAEYV